MHGFDPRMNNVYSVNHLQPLQSQPYAYGPVNHGYSHFQGYSPVQGFQQNTQQLPYDLSFLVQRIEELRAQVLALTTAQGFQTQRSGVFAGHDLSPVRLRESESSIFWEIHLPQITVGDVEVEVHGTRITCRTRVPVAPLNRWIGNQNSTLLPRGIECFELTDGRLEFCWIATVPFTAKEVEATFRDGFLSICIPKAELGARHTVKVVRETAASRRASGDMNS